MVVSPAGEAAHPVGLAGAAGEDDDRELGVDSRRQTVGRPDAVEQVEAAAVLEQEVEHDERGLAHLDRPQTLAHPARAGDAEAVGGEIVEQEGARRVVVLHHKDQALLVHIPRRTASKKLAPAAQRSGSGLQMPLAMGRRGSTTSARWLFNGHRLNATGSLGGGEFTAAQGRHPLQRRRSLAAQCVTASPSVKIAPRDDRTVSAHSGLIAQCVRGGRCRVARRRRGDGIGQAARLRMSGAAPSDGPLPSGWAACSRRSSALSLIASVLRRCRSAAPGPFDQHCAHHAVVLVGKDVAVIDVLAGEIDEVHADNDLAAKRQWEGVR
jgi:hypothetical protein